MYQSANRASSGPSCGLAERCKIHADKMQGEGWYVTANVLAEASERLHAIYEGTGNMAAWQELLGLREENAQLRATVDRIKALVKHSYECRESIAPETLESVLDDTYQE